MIQVFDEILNEELAKITPLEKSTGDLSDAIAARIEHIMQHKKISKSDLAHMTHKRPSEITKWLSGCHNFTCKTIALISLTLGENIVTIPKCRNRNKVNNERSTQKL